MLLINDGSVYRCLPDSFRLTNARACDFMQTFAEHFSRLHIVTRAPDAAPPRRRSPTHSSCSLVQSTVLELLNNLLHGITRHRTSVNSNINCARCSVFELSFSTVSHPSGAALDLHRFGSEATCARRRFQRQPCMKSVRMIMRTRCSQIYSGKKAEPSRCDIYLVFVTYPLRQSRRRRRRPSDRSNSRNSACCLLAH